MATAGSCTAALHSAKMGAESHGCYPGQGKHRPADSRETATPAEVPSHLACAMSPPPLKEAFFIPNAAVVLSAPPCVEDLLHGQVREGELHAGVQEYLPRKYQAASTPTSPSATAQRSGEQNSGERGNNVHKKNPKPTKPNNENTFRINYQIVFPTKTAAARLYSRSPSQQKLCCSHPGREEGMLALFFLSESYLPGQPLTASHQDILLHQLRSVTHASALKVFKRRTEQEVGEKRQGMM